MWELELDQDYCSGWLWNNCGAWMFWTDPEKRVL